MKFKKLLSALKFKLTSFDTEEVARLCGLELKTIKGTIRKTTDQDDAWFFHLANNNDVIYDIGCNVGYTALIAMIQRPEREYILVDPNAKALNKAHFNLLINSLGFNAKYFLGFVSDRVDQLIKFYTIGAGAAGSMYASHAETAASINSYSQVRTTTLDFLYEFYRIKPDLVKIDVEGAEIQVMKGAELLAKQSNCKFFIEMHNVENLGMEQAGQFMIDWCSKNNYRVWYLKNHSELKQAQMIKERGKCHLLLIPSNQNYPTYLKNIPQGAPLPVSLPE